MVLNVFNIFISLYSDQETEWLVQELCDILSLSQSSAADLLARQTEADGALQRTYSRKTYLQPHCAHGELTAQRELLWVTLNLVPPSMHHYLYQCALFLCIQVQSAALDEMFHYGTASVQRYHKALLLMEGLSRIIIEQQDIDSVDKCKWKLKINHRFCICSV